MSRGQQILNTPRDPTGFTGGSRSLYLNEIYLSVEVWLEFCRVLEIQKDNVPSQFLPAFVPIPLASLKR